MDTHKFRVGDKVEVLEIANEVAYPAIHLGINIVESVHQLFSVQVLGFIGHSYECHNKHVKYIPTPLEELL